MSIKELLTRLTQEGGSDLHISTNVPPMGRIDGSLKPMGMGVLDAEAARKLCLEALTPDQVSALHTRKELDFSFALPGVARFRGNIFHQRGATVGVFRVIPDKIKSFEDLGLPAVLKKLCGPAPGLVLVTGATGSGKSTTLAAMIDKINSERADHIITMEDPIEFVHENKCSVVSQREIGTDSESFADALKYALREDPDAILVGEMRDYETIGKAITLAETGHLTFGTLHTSSAVQTISRIIDVFPAGQQAQIRVQLSMVLKGILSQRLLPKKSGSGRVMAMEILIPTQGIRSMIRDNSIHQIESQMMIGQGTTGMQTLDQHLALLFQTGEISLDAALGAAKNPLELSEVIKRGGGAPLERSTPRMFISGGAHA